MNSDHTISLDEEIKNIKVGRPHLVILGAGASLAAFPDGDKNGKKLPLMKDLIEVVGLQSILDKHNIDFKEKNFEEVFSDLFDIDPGSDVLKLIEDKVHGYFGSLKIPDIPTLYDHLLLSLREKDFIASFNWDPFLADAYGRNNGRIPLPGIMFLHGNVAMGYCKKDKVYGPIKWPCPRCGHMLISSKLLYPIKKKDYAQDGLIADHWSLLKQVLKKAYMVTIFGYSAPQTDARAMELMKEGWGKNTDRAFEQIEIIHRPGKTDEDVTGPWNDFIHTHHYQTSDDFYKSLIATHPRRSCEITCYNKMEVKWVLHDNKIPQELSLEELWKWLEPLGLAEQEVIKR